MSRIIERFGSVGYKKNGIGSEQWETSQQILSIETYLVEKVVWGRTNIGRYLRSGYGYFTEI